MGVLFGFARKIEGFRFLVYLVVFFLIDQGHPSISPRKGHLCLRRVCLFEVGSQKMALVFFLVSFKAAPLPNEKTHPSIGLVDPRNPVHSVFFFWV